MPLVLVSNNSALLRHLGSPTIARLALTPRVVTNADEAWTTFDRERPPLALLDVELPGASGYELSARIKAAAPSTRVVLVAGKRLTSEQLRRLAASGCDELVVAPMTADELHDVIAVQLGVPRPGAETHTLAVRRGEQVLATSVANLSVDGLRLVSPAQLGEGTALEVDIELADGARVTAPARVLWSQPGERGHLVAAAFGELSVEARQALTRLTQWEIVRDTERTRVVLKGDFTEATRFDELLAEMVGRIDFDLSQVRYMNSTGVMAWCEFLRAAPIQGYELHACSVPFVVQASMVAAVTGRGTVTSFFAPYHCASCERHEERLLQSAAILAAGLQAPHFTCSACGGALEFDELPDRYFAFLGAGSGVTPRRPR